MAKMKHFFKRKENEIREETMTIIFASNNTRVIKI